MVGRFSGAPGGRKHRGLSSGEADSIGRRLGQKAGLRTRARQPHSASRRKPTILASAPKKINALAEPRKAAAEGAVRRCPGLVSCYRRHFPLELEFGMVNTGDDIATRTLPGVTVVGIGAWPVVSRRCRASSRRCHRS